MSGVSISRSASRSGEPYPLCPIAVIVPCAAVVGATVRRRTRLESSADAESEACALAALHVCFLSGMRAGDGEEVVIPSGAKAAARPGVSSHGEGGGYGAPSPQLEAQALGRRILAALVGTLLGEEEPLARIAAEHGHLRVGLQCKRTT
jgi:hypothetical protein